jgi:multiple sugar transport system ATP-binding protein
VGSQRVALGDETLSTHPALKAYADNKVILGIRPEDLEDASLARDTPADQRLRGEVQLTEALGSEVMVHFAVEARPALTEDVRELAQDIGDERAVAQTETHTTMVGRFGARSKVKEGETTDVAVDTRALHFFDPDTGLGIYGDSETQKGA